MSFPNNIEIWFYELNRKDLYTSGEQYSLNWWYKWNKMVEEEGISSFFSVASHLSFPPIWCSNSRSPAQIPRSMNSNWFLPHPSLCSSFTFSIKRNHMSLTLRTYGLEILHMTNSSGSPAYNISWGFSEFITKRDNSPCNSTHTSLLLFLPFWWALTKAPCYKTNRIISLLYILTILTFMAISLDLHCLYRHVCRGLWE